MKRLSGLIAVAAFVAVGCTKAPEPAAPAAFTPTAHGTLLQVMRGIPFPASNIIFDAQNGDPEKPKDTKGDGSGSATSQYGSIAAYAGWNAVENAAVAIEETANLIMIPFGYACIKTAKQILRVPRNVLMPMIMLFCVVGAFAINNTAFDVGVMVIAGVIAFVLEENGVPIAPAILGVVLGGMLEDNFVTSMIKADGNLLAFFERPVAATLGALTIAVWFLPLLMRRLRRLAGV